MHSSNGWYASAILIISEHNITNIEPLIDSILFFHGHGEYDYFAYNNKTKHDLQLQRIIRTSEYNYTKKKNYISEKISLKISNLKFNFNKKNIFNNLNLTLHESNIIGITGDNGAGKTTLLKLIAGMIKEFSGKIVKSGKVCYIDQDPDKLIYADTIENEINFEKKHSLNEIDNLINKLGITHLRGRNPIELSIGEKLIEEYVEKQCKTIITALTDKDLAERYCSKIYKIVNGRMEEIKK